MSDPLFFFFPFGFDADAYEGVGVEEHIECGRLLPCPNGDGFLETPSHPPGDSCATVSGDARVGATPEKCIAFS